MRWRALPRSRRAPHDAFASGRSTWCSRAGRFVPAALLLLPAIGGNPCTSAAATLEPARPGLGQRAVLRLQQAAADSSQQPVGLGVALLATADPRVLTAVPLQVGRVGIALGAGESEAPGAAPGARDTLWWEISGQLAEASPDSLRPLKAAPELGPNWLPTALILAVLLGMPAWWLWRRRGRRPARALAFPLPEEPAHRVALRRLAEIAGTRWLEDGQFDRYFVECTRAMRAYIAARYRVPALDWTSDEIVERLRQAGYDRRDLADVGPLLAEADRVKFGADRPTQHSSQQWLGRARTFIEYTAVEPEFTTPEAVAAAAALTRRAAA